MADEQVIPVTPAPVAAPVEASSTPAQTPVVAAVEAAPAAVVEAPKAPETVLGDALSKEPKPAPAEAPKEGEKPVEKVEQKVQEAKSDEPAPAPVYDPFTVPEGITLDTERVSKFTDIMSKLEQTGKVDHALVQQFGQEAVDLHISEVKKAQEALNDLYKTSWDKQKTDWKDAFLKDPEIGGNRFQTTVDSALNFIRTHGGNTEQQTEFRNLMETSGLGNHPAMIRLLANAGRAMQEGKPLAATKPAPVQKSKIETMYGKSA